MPEDISILLSRYKVKRLIIRYFFNVAAAHIKQKPLSCLDGVNRLISMV